MKIIINTCYGGFDISHKATMRYAELKGIHIYPYLDSITKEVYGTKAMIDNEKLSHHYSLVPINLLPTKTDSFRADEPILNNEQYFSLGRDNRTDPILIQVVEEMGKEANGHYAELKVIEIPNDIQYDIVEYDGIEHVAEIHRVWS